MSLPGTAIGSTSALDRAARVEQSRLATAYRRLKSRPGAYIGGIIVLLFILIAIFAPLLAPFDPTEISNNRRAVPSWAHPFGTDELGRDVLSRVIYGARVSLRVGLIAVSIAAVCGSLLGVAAAYFGGWFDSVVMRIMDVMLAFPGILLAIAIVAILGPSLFNVMVAVGIEAIPVYTRTARASTLVVREVDYVTGALAAGSTNSRILFRHILPNIMAPLIVLASIGVAGAILAAAGLSYLGLGAQPPTPEWGAMLSSSRNYLRDSWWMATFPGCAIMIVILALNLFGDGLRDILDPRGSR